MKRIFPRLMPWLKVRPGRAPWGLTASFLDMAHLLNQARRGHHSTALSPKPACPNHSSFLEKPLLDCYNGRRRWKGSVLTMEMGKGAEAKVKAYTVAQAVARFRHEPALVEEGATLLQVAEAAVRHPYCRTLAVVDGNGRLLGIIPLSSLVDDVFVHIMPEEFLDD